MSSFVDDESNKRQRVVDQDVDDETREDAFDDHGDSDVEVVNVVPGTHVEQKGGESDNDDDDNKNEEDEDEDEVEVVGITPGTAVPESKAQQQQQQPLLPPTSVFIVMTCDYPLQNEKCGEYSGHETQDTAILGVFAKRPDANRFAREEWNEYAGLDDSDDENDDDEDDELFYRQEEEPSEWTAHRIWVEEKPLHYNY